MRTSLRILEAIVLVICFPFYAVAIPFMLLYEWIVPRVRKVSLGLQLRRWVKPDVLEEIQAVDVSRLADGLVGVVRRQWNVLYHKDPPAFPQEIEFCTISYFWLGHEPLLQRKSWMNRGKTSTVKTTL
ncbi:hypothetical protein NA78x_005767 [Anatilimnocola sp. NA78]|uniref:hypothetical protein n=1 Tax=Anatilimnocola sp. NA78 TaxID=3415683 RepID=UPI003CE57188